MKPAYAIANDQERAGLETLLSGLSDDDLAKRLPNGLTIAHVLVHLAFWDQYTAAALGGWTESGYSESRTNFDAVNAALGVLADVIPPRASVDLACAAARFADAEAEAVSPDLANVIEANGKMRMLERHRHRRVHIDQIKSVVSTT